MRKFENINWHKDWVDAVKKLGVEFASEASLKILDEASDMYISTKLLPESIVEFVCLEKYQAALAKINEGIPESKTDAERQAVVEARAEEAYWQEQEQFPVKSLVRGTRHDQSEGERKRLRRIEPWTMSIRPTHNGRGMVREGDRMTFNWKRHDRRLARRQGKAECRAF